MATNIKRIDIKEFWEKGFLAEANRRFFHPLGLALEVIVDQETGEVSLGGLWDYRDDPEGILYTKEEITHPEVIEKFHHVQNLWDEKARVRQEKYGWVIQPIGQDRVKE